MNIIKEPEMVGCPFCKTLSVFKERFVTEEGIKHLAGFVGICENCKALVFNFDEGEREETMEKIKKSTKIEDWETITIVDFISSLTYFKKGQLVIFGLRKGK